MIYCVVPEELAGELYDKLCTRSYYVGTIPSVDGRSSTAAQRDRRVERARRDGTPRAGSRAAPRPAPAPACAHSGVPARSRRPGAPE